MKMEGHLGRRVGGEAMQDVAAEGYPGSEHEDGEDKALLALVARPGHGEGERQEEDGGLADGGR